MENLLIRHCSPVLGGLKTGNLFNYKTSKENAVYQCNKLRAVLAEKGISLDIIKSSDEYSLIYVYRKQRLEKDVNNPLAKKILKERDYNSFDCESLVKHLKQRVEKSVCFPHEIGLFLSYPPEDVLGFIDNRGGDFKICGYWKVYCNEETALKKFAMYKHCTEIFIKLFNEGRSFENLLVAI